MLSPRFDANEREERLAEALPRPMIELRNVSKWYRTEQAVAVDELSLEVRRGEFLVLTGPSGCGKTTTLKMINRIIEPSSGMLLLDGQDVTRVPAHELRQRIGYVIQSVGLFPHMRIEDNVAVVPRLLGWDKRRISERVDELLDLVGLEPGAYRRRYPRELSGGQAQRVGVARALAGDPPVLLMDEPFAAVDPITRATLQAEFLRLQSTLHKTVVFVTHDMGEAMRLADRVAVLGPRATVVQLGTPTEVLAAPADDFVAEMLGAGRMMHLLSSVPLRGVPLSNCPATEEGCAPDLLERAAAAAERAGIGRVLLLTDGRPRQWLPVGPRGRDGQGPSEVGCVVTEEGTSLRDALDRILLCPESCAVVVDGHGRFRGLLDLAGVRTLLARTGAPSLGGGLPT